MFKTNRASRYPVHELILNRWSPRSFSDEMLTENELMTLFEAAHWAQSSYNNQPWRFVYSLRNSASWNTFTSLLEPGNLTWAQYASVLVAVVSKTTFDYDERPSRTHSFDVGAAAQCMALQGASMDIVVHGMEGFDYDRAHQELKLTEKYQIEALFAIGKRGGKEGLERLPEKLRDREHPSDRKPVERLYLKTLFLSSNLCHRLLLILLTMLQRQNCTCILKVP